MYIAISVIWLRHLLCSAAAAARLASWSCTVWAWSRAVQSERLRTPTTQPPWWCCTAVGWLPSRTHETDSPTPDTQNTVSVHRYFQLWVAWWCNGRASDSRSNGCWVRLLAISLSGNNSRQVVHTHGPLSSSSINWYIGTGKIWEINRQLCDTSAPCPWSCSFSCV